MYRHYNIPTQIAVAGVFLVIAFNFASAADAPLFSATTLRPISGQGTNSDQKFLLTLAIGQKQTISYFENQDGRCKLTVMVGEASKGEDVPDVTSVRFETKIAPSRTALFDTAQGKGLEFKCLDAAESISVRTIDRVGGYAPAM